MHKAKIHLEQEVSLNDIFFGKDDCLHDLSAVLFILHKNITECIQDISIQRQSVNPNLEDIDAPLHSALSLIEKVRGF